MAFQVHVYTGTAGHSAWFSEDAGETWVHPNSHSGMYLEARVWCIATHPAEPAAMFAGSDLGLFRWDEPAARWTALESPMTDIWALAIDPHNPAILLAGTRPAGFYRSVDAGRHWMRLEAPGISQYSPVNMGPTRVTQILFDPMVRDAVWATVEIGGIYRSVDGGLHWSLHDQGLVSADVHGIAVVGRPDGTDVVLATTNQGLHRSTDRGGHWQFQPLPAHWPYVRAIVPRADDSGVLFLCNGNGPPGNDGRLLRSRDHGDTWETVDLPGDIHSTLWCVATNAADPMLLFCCTNLGQLYRSTDGGESWASLPQQFGEVRALHWRPVADGVRRDPHAITRPVQRAPRP